MGHLLRHKGFAYILQSMGKWKFFYSKVDIYNSGKINCFLKDSPKYC